MTKERWLQLAAKMPEGSLIWLKRCEYRRELFPKRLVKFRVNTKFNGRTTVWLTSRGYMIQDTINKWFEYMSDAYIDVLRIQKQII